jgi:hypothetical protein
MSDDETRQILEEIIDLARLLGWTSALAQDKNNQILGVYIGLEEWINAKLGKSTNITH